MCLEQLAGAACLGQCCVYFLVPVNFHASPRFKAIEGRNHVLGKLAASFPVLYTLLFFRPQLCQCFILRLDAHHGKRSRSGGRFCGGKDWRG